MTLSGPFSLTPLFPNPFGLKLFTPLHTYITSFQPNASTFLLLPSLFTVSNHHMIIFAPSGALSIPTSLPHNLTNSNHVPLDVFSLDIRKTFGVISALILPPVKFICPIMLHLTQPLSHFPIALPHPPPLTFSMTNHFMFFHTPLLHHLLALLNHQQHHPIPHTPLNHLS